MKAWFLPSVLAALLLGVLLGHYGAPKCPECPPHQVVQVVPPLVKPEELHPSGEHLVAEAVNEVFEKGVKDNVLPLKKPMVWDVPGESKALHDWHQANVEWIACLGPKANWCDAGRSMKDYEKWELEHPRPEK